ncbi:MAG: hypothetical protein EXR63_04045 [Dehalococcoidia bacterium]|nr:hypothetical protein [Dehalococcoidia bacterium]
MAQHASHAAFGRQPKHTYVQWDEAVQWGCSLKGWNCCVDKGIAVRPYDLVRLRHAVGRPSNEITSDETVTFAWHGGLLIGSLAHKPYTPGHVACTFFEEMTNVSARALRERDPDAFAALPERVRAAADSPAKGEYRVAGLCGAHQNRPEVCRAFPYQREVGLVLADGTLEDVRARRVNLCGSCALSTPTTPRAVVENEDVAEYWRANDAFSAVASYYRSRGAGNFDDPRYRSLPLPQADLTQLWAAMYLPDSDPIVRERYPEQWRAALDVEGDRAIHALVLQHALDRLDALLTQLGVDSAALGTKGAPDVPRPQLDRLLDPAREPIPPATPLPFAPERHLDDAPLHEAAADTSAA